MRKFFVMSAAAFLATCGTLNAQPINRALSFTAEGTVDCGAMPELNGLDSYSVQFWMMPDNWTEGATIFKRGDNFSVKLGADNTVVFTNGENAVVATGFVPNEWNQVTLMCNNGVATVLVNSADGGNGTLGSLDETKRAFIMGGGYEGLLDEVRLWNDALTNNEWMERLDCFTNNTLNKWNPMWENLVAYYKMDQENCPVLVEYKVLESEDAESNNHGVLSSGVSRVVAANEKMPYLVSAAYTENARFYDRLIPQDAYLLSNEIIILGADCDQTDGSVHLRTPNNHGTVHGGVTAVDQKGAYSGVVYLDGQPGTYIEAPAESLHTYRNDANSDIANPTLDTFSFLTRFFVDQWQPGACLMRIGNGNNGLSIELAGTEDAKQIVINLNGGSYSFEINNYREGMWNHVGIAQAKNSRGTSYEYTIAFNNTQQTYDDSNCTIENFSLSEVAGQPVIVGEGLNGWLDETLFVNNKLGIGMIQTYANQIIVPTVEQGRNVADMNATGFAFKYDDPDNIGYSSWSQDNMLYQIKKQYEGYTAPRVILSVRGHSDNSADDAFRVIMNDPAKADKFGKDLVALGENYDGIEFDLEWMENSNTAGTNNFQSLPTAVKKYLPEGKIFRVSIHNSYYKFAEPLIDDDQVTGFTVQQYGPNTTPYPYSSFTSALSTLKNEGYPENKLMTSFASTMTSGGVKDGALANYEWNNGTAGDTYNGATFMGPAQVYKRAKYTRENGYMGIFYWDMGNDYWLGNKNMGSGGVANYEGMPEYNQTKFANFALSANVDRVVNEVAVNHPDTEAEPDLSITPDPSDPENPDDDDTAGVTSFLNDMPEYVNVYNMAGVLVKSNVSKKEVLNQLGKGLYIINNKKICVK